MVLTAEDRRGIGSFLATSAAARGYPVVLGPVRPVEQELAREAVTACPRRALHLLGG